MCVFSFSKTHFLCSSFAGPSYPRLWLLCLWTSSPSQLCWVLHGHVGLGLLGWRTCVRGFLAGNAGRIGRFVCFCPGSCGPIQSPVWEPEATRCLWHVWHVFVPSRVCLMLAFLEHETAIVIFSLLFLHMTDFAQAGHGMLPRVCFGFGHRNVLVASRPFIGMDVVSWRIGQLLLSTFFDCHCIFLVYTASRALQDEKLESC